MRMEHASEPVSSLPPSPADMRTLLAHSQQHGYDSDIDEEAQRIASNQAASTSAVPDKPKLSTGVHLLKPEAAQGRKQQHKERKQKAKAKGAPIKKGAAAAVAPPALQPFPQLIQAFMASQGFTEPTPIQEQCWAGACAGKDVQGVAEPGSGKTLSYLLPAFHKLKVGHMLPYLPMHAPVNIMHACYIAALRTSAIQASPPCPCKHCHFLTSMRR